MMYALRDPDHERIRAAKGLTGICPCCRSTLIPHCGLILAHHWSHAANDCDPWHEGESDWHLWWKSKAPRDWCEVVIGEHRADIGRDDGVVIELQHSPLDPATIREREEFYGKMIWLIDLRDVQHHIAISGDGDPVAFRWAHARRSWGYSTKPKFLDLGDRVLEVLTLSEDAARGTGRGLSVDAFLARARLAPMTAAERAKPVRYEVRQSNDRTAFLRPDDWSRKTATSAMEYDRDKAREIARTEPRFAKWIPVGATALDGHDWHLDDAAMVKTGRGSLEPRAIRSFDWHAADLTVIARSGRRQTLQRDLARLVRTEDRLALQYAFGGDPLPLYRRVAARDYALEPTSRPALPAPTSRVCLRIQTSSGPRMALPMAGIPRVAPTVRPICPPPKLPALRDCKPERDWDGRWGRIVPEPRANVYGRFKVLRRTDDLFVVLDPDGPLDTTWPVFELEADARRWAAVAATRPPPPTRSYTAQDFRDWLADRPRTAART
jgi:competence protein CoiA